jgi:opacity protein-like surface antigen
MRVLSTLALSVSFIVIFLISPATFAADKYIGVGIGISEIEDSGFDSISGGFKFFGGARIHQHFAIEAAYMNFGKPEEDFFGIKGEYDLWELGAWAKGILPVHPQFEVFAKAGLVHWELDATRTLFGFAPVSISAAGHDFSWGLGAAFNASAKISIQLEYDQADVDVDKATLWTAAGVFHF